MEEHCTMADEGSVENYLEVKILSPEQAIKRICKYLLGTMDQGLMLSSDMFRSIECFVDTDFSGNWRPEDAEDRTRLLSSTVFVIFFCGYPITFLPLFHIKYLRITMVHWNGHGSSILQLHTIISGIV